MTTVICDNRPAGTVTIKVLRGTGIDLAGMQARLDAMEQAIAEVVTTALPTGTDGDLLIWQDGQWTATDTLPLG